MDPRALTNRLKVRAHQNDFAMCGVAPAVRPAGADQLDEWLARGYAGEMDYIGERRDAYEHPRHVLDNVRSILMLAMHYRTEPRRTDAMGRGYISSYAWGSVDYHDLIRTRLHKLADYLRELVPAAKTRGVVDTAPLLEREFAQLAGLGWIGKHTLTLNRDVGSYFFLAALLTDQVLEYDESRPTDHCGTCTACLDACPTDAFPQPYVLDASRCISYLTIEHRSQIPVELREGMENWLFGCDVCQDVCPWNRRAPRATVAEFQPEDGQNPIELAELFDLNEEAFRSRFRHTPLWRPHRRGLLRNAAIVLGNQRAEVAVSALTRGLEDPEPIVRGACAWALGQIATLECIAVLEAQRAVEEDDDVQMEIRRALATEP